MPEELATLLTQLRAWWVDLEEVNATIGAAIVRHGAAAAREREELLALCACAEETVTRLQREYGNEAYLGTFCGEDLRSMRWDLDHAQQAQARTAAQKVLDACVARRTQLEESRVERQRIERERLAAVEARDSVVADLESLAYGYFGGASEFTSAADRERYEAADLDRAIADAFERRRYAVVLEKARQARELIATVRERQASRARQATEETLRLARIQHGIPEPARVVDGTMEEAGKRHFRCSCGRMEKVSVLDWQLYQAGQPLTLTCGGCHKTATVKK